MIERSRPMCVLEFVGVYLCIDQFVEAQALEWQAVVLLMASLVSKRMVGWKSRQT